MNIEKSNKLKRNLKQYWKKIDKIEDVYWHKIHLLEMEIEKETGIKDIELFHCDGEIVGIGNINRTMKLIHRR